VIKDDNGSELEQVRCRGPVASISTRRLEEGKGEVGVDGVHRWCRCGCSAWTGPYYLW
jgi:hypothetical protein